MDLDGLRVNHAGLDQAAEDLRGIVDKISARMNELEQDLAPLRASWVGEAQQAYTVAKARWDGAIHEMKDLLSATSRQVRLSNAEYQAADTRGARSFDI
jgi:early secretory antigenic target protein ESAT-6